MSIYQNLQFVSQSWGGPQDGSKKRKTRKYTFWIPTSLNYIFQSAKLEISLAAKSSCSSIVGRDEVLRGHLAAEQLVGAIQYPEGGTRSGAGKRLNLKPDVL